MSMPSQAVMAISMYSEMFVKSRGQGLLFVNLVRRVRCDPPQDTVQSDQQSMGSGAAISPPGFDAKTMHRLPAPLPQTGYDASACKTNVQEVGEWMRCSIGVGTNRFLAKLAASLHKPDGLDVIDHTNVSDVYRHASLLDLCGINT